MNKPETISADRIRLQDHRIVEFHTEAPFEFLAKEIKNFTTDIGFRFSFNLQDQMVKIDFNLNVKSKSDGGNPAEAEGRFSIGFVFRVENLEQLVQKDEEGRLKGNADLARVLAGLAYDTARGILLIRLLGTPLRGFTLPVVNPSDLMKKKDHSSL